MTVSLTAKAGLYAGTDFFYLSDNFDSSTDTNFNTTYFGFDLIANIDSKGFYYVGFHGHQYANTHLQGTTTISLTTLDMGPFIKWVIGRQKMFALSLGYNLIATGTQVTGTTSAQLDGTSILASFDITPPISETWYIGVRLNYYILNYTRSTIGSSVTNVSYNKNVMFPTFTIAWRK